MIRVKHYILVSISMLNEGRTGKGIKSQFSDLKANKRLIVKSFLDKTLLAIFAETYTDLFLKCRIASLLSLSAPLEIDRISTFTL